MEKRILYLIKRNLLFYLSRKIDYPLVAPDLVQVNFSFDCNLRCSMCSMHEQMKLLENRGRQIEIDSDAFKKVIRETKELGAGAVLFIGGEPFLRRDLFELVGFAKGLGLGTVIVTNGVLLGRDNIQGCFDSGVDWLSISIDSVDEGTLSKIRGKGVLAKIIANIELLNAQKKEQGRDFPKIVSVCTIMAGNLEELPDIVHFCRGIGIERLLFQPVVANNIDQTQRQNVFTGFEHPETYAKLDRSLDWLINYKKESRNNFDFIGNSIRHLKLIKKYFRGKVSPGSLPCYAGYNRVQIVQEGKLYFCVNQKKYDANFGDIKEDNLKDLWYSGRAKFYRKLIRKCRFPCLQWCSYRDEFIELLGIFQKKLLFTKRKPG